MEERIGVPSLPSDIDRCMAWKAMLRLRFPRGMPEFWCCPSGLPADDAAIQPVLALFSDPIYHNLIPAILPKPPFLPMMRHSLCLIFLGAASWVEAQIPQILNYQGRVAVGTPAINFDGSGSFRFALVNGPGTTVY